MALTLATYGRELVTNDTGGFSLAPDAAPKLVLIAMLVLVLALWLRMHLRSPRG